MAASSDRFFTKDRSEKGLALLDTIVRDLNNEIAAVHVHVKLVSTHKIRWSCHFDAASLSRSAMMKWIIGNNHSVDDRSVVERAIVRRASGAILFHAGARDEDVLVLDRGGGGKIGKPSFTTRVGSEMLDRRASRLRQRERAGQKLAPRVFELFSSS